MSGSLAEDLALVLIDGVGDAPRADRVDRAMAEALSAIEPLLEGDRPSPADAAVARLAAGFLADLRHGTLDRIACRVAAPIVIDRLGRCLGVEEAAASVAPLLQVLSALAEVPDGQRPAGGGVDAPADPSRPLEVALRDVLTGAGSRHELLDALATATVHLPVLQAAIEQDHLAVRLVPMVLREGVVACAFTSEVRAAEVLSEARCAGAPTLALTGAELVDLWPAGHGLVLNPGAVLGTTVSEREVRGLGFRVPDVS